MRIFSFDIENIYTNIPKHDTVNIISNILKIIQKPTKTSRMKYYTYYKHWWNKLSFDEEYYKQTGVDEGAPTSAVLAEIYLQHMEHKQIYLVLIKQQPVNFRYVEGILIIYDQNKRNIEQMLDKFNKQQHSVKFNTEKELHNSSFLYLMIHHKD
jgi:hypothetical protein